ncbi:MAG: hypothetical protein GXY05_16125 [Clostridiales bacterium]|nr:hypothetical protein [Clostridiales bacterium]
MLKTYADFLSCADTCGVMVFSGKFTEGFPNLYDMTAHSQWHTSDPDTDPWQWRDRAAMDKRLAFGNILGGRKGFISPKLYPLFYSACRPDGSMEERWRWGHVKKTVYDVYRLFEEGTPLDTVEIRRRMNVRKSEGASAVDSAVVTLQREFYITVCGNRRKVSFDGTEYGWPANIYCLVDDWAADWLKEPLLPTDEARARILAHITGLNRSIDIKKTKKLLFGAE